jgi:hypothetical protein
MEIEAVVRRHSSPGNDSRPPFLLNKVMGGLRPRLDLKTSKGDHPLSETLTIPLFHCPTIHPFNALAKIKINAPAPGPKRSSASRCNA